jgi:hypothetical protein
MGEEKAGVMVLLLEFNIQHPAFNIARSARFQELKSTMG